MFASAEKYMLKRSADISKWATTDVLNKTYDVIIIIPSYAESSTLLDTLSSIKEQIDVNIQNTLVIVVINNERNPEASIYNDNLKTHSMLSLLEVNYDLSIIDCYTSTNWIEDKRFGVGYVRKVGLDNAIWYSNEKTILCWLDADTTIESEYIKKLTTYYKSNLCSSLVTNFNHSDNESTSLNEYIHKYEKFLKSTAQKLADIGSIYKYVPLGPTITCTAETYIHIGGLTPKKATEDFYFIQDLCKYGNIMFAEDIYVYPSSRLSSRVYLGTGYRMTMAAKGEGIESLYFSKLSFQILSNMLIILLKSYNDSYEQLIDKINDIDSNLLSFLNKQGFAKSWDGINNSSPTQKHFEMQFQRYFDWLKTIKLLKYYS